MAENQSQGMKPTPSAPAAVPNLFSTPIKIFAGNDAKRMSFDENMPYTPQYSGSPLSSMFSQSPGGYNPARRDSLKNMVHLQDFGTD
jgi:hypothetical protein